MYERFTDRARKVMQLANQETKCLNHEYMGTEHLLIGLLKECSGVGCNVLKNLGLDLTKAHVEILKLVQPGSNVVTMDRMPLTPRAKSVIDKAIEWSKRLKHNHIGTEHLLLGIVSEPEGIAVQVLLNSNISLAAVKQEVLNIFSVNNKPDAGEAKQDMHTHGKLLRDLTATWLTAWIGARHQCDSDNCAVCEMWDAHDAMFRYL